MFFGEPLHCQAPRGDGELPSLLPPPDLTEAEQFVAEMIALLVQNVPPAINVVGEQVVDGVAQAVGGNVAEGQVIDGVAQAVGGTVAEGLVVEPPADLGPPNIVEGVVEE